MQASPEQNEFEFSRRNPCFYKSDFSLFPEQGANDYFRFAILDFRFAIGKRIKFSYKDYGASRILIQSKIGNRQSKMPQCSTRFFSFNKAY
jgi:hypothetical protein